MARPLALLLALALAVVAAEVQGAAAAAGVEAALAKGWARVWPGAAIPRRQRKGDAPSLCPPFAPHSRRARRAELDWRSGQNDLKYPFCIPLKYTSVRRLWCGAAEMEARGELAAALMEAGRKPEALAQLLALGRLRQGDGAPSRSPRTPLRLALAPSPLAAPSPRRPHRGRQGCPRSWARASPRRRTGASPRATTRAANSTGPLRTPSKTP
jgi:hypothetical protein